MKLNLDKRYTKFCKYIILTAVIIYVIFRVIDYVPFIYDNILGFLFGILDITFPIILGFIIAYLLFAPMNAIETFLMNRKHFPHKKGLCRAIGVIVSYVLVIGIIIFLIVGIYFMIGGQLSKSSTFSTIVNYISDYFSDNSLSAQSLKDFISSKNIPFGDLIVEKLDSIAVFLQGIALSMVSSISDFIFALGSNLFSLVISLTLSIYILFSYEYFIDFLVMFFYIIFRNINFFFIMDFNSNTLPIITYFNGVFFRYNIDINSFH